MRLAKWRDSFSSTHRPWPVLLAARSAVTWRTKVAEFRSS